MVSFAGGEATSQLFGYLGSSKVETGRAGATTQRSVLAYST